MPFPWQSFMGGREQDREIRKFLDQLEGRATVLESRATALEATRVSQAYGGMRYRNDSPPSGTLDTTPVKIVLYDHSMPINGTPVNVSFDQPNSEVVVSPGHGGVYEITYFLSFQGVQTRNYTINVYLDSGTGAQPAGDPITVRVSSQDPFAEVQLSTIAKLDGGWRLSIWANSDTNGSTFEVFGTSLYIVRKSIELPDGADPVISF